MSELLSKSTNLLWYDYAVVVIMLLISALIGMYFGWFRKRQQSIAEYLHGGNNMTWVPVGLSVAASHLSNAVLTLLPGEVYKYGANMLWILPVFFINALIGIYVILPTFFELKVTSFIEYIEKRFDSKTKYVALVLYVTQQIFLFAYVSYTSAIVLATEMNINAYLVSIGLSSICIFYAAIGGLKTVIWSDIFQFAFVSICYIAIVLAGLQATGGLKSMYIAAKEGERLDIFDFDLDPTKRDSFWIIVFGFGLQNLFHKLIDQTSIQKFLALPSYETCIKSVLYSAATVALVFLFAVLIGLVMYTKYQLCDPLTLDPNLKIDQLVSHFVMDLGRNTPGLSGLFAVATLCAGLSSMSSMLNASSGIVYKDFVCKLSKTMTNPQKGHKIIKLIVVLVGLLSISISYFFTRINGIFAIAMGICSIINGPLIGLVLLGILSSKISAKSSFYATIGSSFFLGCIIFTSIYAQNKALYTPPSKPVSIAGCRTNMSTNFTVTTHTHEVPAILKISFYYSTTVGLVLIGALALLLSYTCCKNTRTVDPELLFRGCAKKLQNSTYSGVPLEAVE